MSLKKTNLFNLDRYLMKNPVMRKAWEDSGYTIDEDISILQGVE
jgi:hypothetical protein